MTLYISHYLLFGFCHKGFEKYSIVYVFYFYRRQTSWSNVSISVNTDLRYPGPWVPLPRLTSLPSTNPSLLYRPVDTYLSPVSTPNRRGSGGSEGTLDSRNETGKFGEPLGQPFKTSLILSELTRRFCISFSFKPPKSVGLRIRVQEQDSEWTTYWFRSIKFKENEGKGGNTFYNGRPRMFPRTVRILIYTTHVSKMTSQLRTV